MHRSDRFISANLNQQVVATTHPLMQPLEIHLVIMDNDSKFVFVFSMTQVTGMNKDMHYNRYTWSHMTYIVQTASIRHSLLAK